MSAPDASAASRWLAEHFGLAVSARDVEHGPAVLRLIWSHAVRGAQEQQRLEFVRELIDAYTADHGPTHLLPQFRPIGHGVAPGTVTKQVPTDINEHEEEAA